jgi:hypothetical protein
MRYNRQIANLEKPDFLFTETKQQIFALNHPIYAFLENHHRRNHPSLLLSERHSSLAPCIASFKSEAILPSDLAAEFTAKGHPSLARLRGLKQRVVSSGYFGGIYEKLLER